MKLISLNIEGKKHLARVIPFLRREKADVVCLQEVFEKDALHMARTFRAKHEFSPMTIREGEKKGIATITRLPVRKTRTLTYHKPSQVLKKYEEENKAGTIRQILLVAEVKEKGRISVVGNTHFTWTPDGLSDINQRKDIKALMRALEKFPEIVLCGDFNIPRGVNDLYENIIEKYRDAVPKSYASSLDMRLHRMGKNKKESGRMKKFMVDYIFLSKEYVAKKVRLVSGVSDHKAVVGLIDKTG